MPTCWAWSPQYISVKLKVMEMLAATNPVLSVVSHETIYRAIYVIARGELRKDLIGFLRQATTRAAHAGAVPTGVATLWTRFPSTNGHMIWSTGPFRAIGRAMYGSSSSTSFFKDAGNASAIGTFVERKSLAYDEGKEMARYKEPASRLDMPVYFSDPNSSW